MQPCMSAKSRMPKQLLGSNSSKGKSTIYNFIFVCYCNFSIYFVNNHSMHPVHRLIAINLRQSTILEHYPESLLPMMCTHIQLTTAMHDSQHPAMLYDLVVILRNQ